MNVKNLKAVYVGHFFTAPANKVFTAWLDPSMIQQWLFAGPGSEVVNVEVDAREGGSFSILEKINNEYIDHYGEYIEINPPNRLVFTLSVPKHFPGVTRVAVELEEVKNGCELKLTQTGITPEETEKTWRDMLHQLAHVLHTANN